MVIAAALLPTRYLSGGDAPACGTSVDLSIDPGELIFSPKLLTGGNKFRNGALLVAGDPKKLRLLSLRGGQAR
jgi:hypothetical protein